LLLLDHYYLQQTSESLPVEDVCPPIEACYRRRT